ncbi:hypothetical protein PRB20_005368, partial [Salmonella enterica]|nr:hypothetical protein [Salmonella enterica]EKM3984918.1 hypothetical protein [Salmonella enterica]
IAAAAMASFGASAAAVVGYPSSASVNTTVTGKVGLTIKASGETMNTDEFFVNTQKLGSFSVTIPTEYNNVAGITLGDIHAHNYPDGYMIKISDKTGNINTCTATITGGTAGSIVNSVGEVPINGQQCSFPVNGKSIQLDLTNNGSAGTTDPGVKTITALFTAYSS